MRTTIDIPEELILEAKNLLGLRSKSDTIIFSLRELIRNRRIEELKSIKELKSMAGLIHLDLDLDASRRRPHYHT